MIGPLLTAFITALILVAIFSLAFNNRGPWGSVWTFFLVLFLGIWAVALWVRPIGVYTIWGVDWLPAVVIGLMLAFLIVAIVPAETDASTRADRNAAVDKSLPEERKAGVAMGAFFWVLLILFVIIIILGNI